MGLGAARLRGAQGLHRRTWGVGISWCCSIQVAPAVGTNPCLRWLECEEPPAPWDRQRPWPWVIAFWGVEAGLCPLVQAESLGSGWALAEALRLFLFSYKQDRTQSSIKLKNKKRARRRVGCS